ncbi:MAG: hypothetical protein HFI38_11840 [Lachnospiraceae bacterium]|jgi:hypothetical protein|nr:hypothetical protein [Lachnospiraceae bacterium]
MKNGIRKALILIFVFLAAAAAVFYFTRSEDEPATVYEGMSEASLPVVYALYGGERVNRLYGYREEMAEEYMRDDVTPLGNDGQMSISVDCYGNELTGISYEVRDADSGRLIEATEVKTWSGKEDAASGQGGREGQDGMQEPVTAVLPIQKLIEEGREYLLRIRLTTTRHEAVYYYTRILYSSTFHVQEMLDFVRNFSARTLEPAEKQEGSSELGLYIEPDKTGDNTSLACVNIHSSHRMLTWLNLEPERISEPMVDIRQINGNIGTLRLTYQVQAPGDSGLMEIYDVEEVLVIRWSEVRFYLLAYERTMNQQFKADTTTIENGVVSLGVVEDGSTKLQTSPSGAYTVFTASGELWSYNSKVNEAVNIFSFRNGMVSDIRTEHREHDFQIIDVKDNGDVTFMAYGYMNSGSHEGEVSMIFYLYDSSERALQEIFYIPAYTSYALLRQEMGTLSFISETGLIYVMVGNSIYAIDVVGTEQVLVVDDLKEESFVISDDNSVIAWQEGDDPYGCESLSVMYLTDGRKNTIRAGAGEYLKPLGFIGTDFIYGIADKTDITVDISGRITFPMYAMEIVGREGTILSHYEKPGYHIMGVEVDGGRIQVDRVTLSYDKQPEEALADVLLQNAEEDTGTASVLKTSVSERKRKVYSINLSGQASPDRTLTIQTPVRLLGSSANRVELAAGRAPEGAGTGNRNGQDKDPRFFAYAYGRLASICYNVSDAIGAIYDRVGIVVDSGQNVVWARGNQKAEARITVNSACVTDREDLTLVPCIQALLFQQGIAVDVTEMLNRGSSVWEILEEALPGRALDLTGCTLQQALYFISQGHPVILLTGETTAELMVGYDNYNITFYNVTDGSYYKVGRNDTAAHLEEMGGYLFSYR